MVAGGGMKKTKECPC